MKSISFTIFRTVLLAVFLLIAIDGKAQSAGSLDPTYGNFGRIAAQIINGADLVDMTIQPDGKIIVIGTLGNPIVSQFVARFNLNGTFDTTFNGIGYNTTDTMSRFSSVTLQLDGKILVGGVSNKRYFSVARYNTNGTIDTNFNGSGVVATQVGTDSSLTSLNVQADGKIVAAGETRLTAASGDFDFALVRYNTDGSLDNSLGAGGQVITDINTNSNDYISDSAIQTDGKILVAGYFSNNGASNPYFPIIVRYTSQGTLDTTFGTGGKLIESGYVNKYARRIALQADGKIIIVGEGFTPLRYNSNGTLDTTFQAPQTPGYYFAQSVAIQTDGKIVVGGGERGVNNTGSSSFAVVRYNTDGTLDAPFGNNGKLLTSFADYQSSAYVTAINIQPDGRIVVGGNSDKHLLLLARYRNRAVYKANFVDFNGDGKDDISFFRPSNTYWYISTNLATNFNSIQFGAADDKLVPADYDGDGKTDLAVYRNGTWYLQRSSLGFTGVAFGDGNDIPVPADYDGDGKADIAVFRPSNGTWYLQQSTAGFTGVAFGQNGDKPVAADYDGDGKADVAVNRTGTWYINRSTNGFYGVAFGDSNDKLVPADYDGDGKADIAVFRPSNGTWYIQQSTAGFTGVAFGLGTDIPTPADYDGDGKADVAVFRNGTWYLNRSSQGFTGIAFGASTDKPLPNAFVR